MCILTITVVLIFIPNMVLGDSLNLTGSLNVNDTQIINTSNLLVSMLVSLAEAIIPILVGAAVGHKSINHWQEKKDRIASKNNIFTDYAQSFKCHSTLLDNFVERVFKSYVVFQKDDNSRSKDRLYLDHRLFQKGNKDVIEKLQNIGMLLKRSEVAMTRFFQSTNINDFISFHNNYLSLSDKIRDETDKFELELVQLK